MSKALEIINEILLLLARASGRNLSYMAGEKIMEGYNKLSKIINE